MSETLPPVLPEHLTAFEAYFTSHAQRRLWVLQEMHPDSTAYSLPGAILLEGPFDIDAFRGALQDLVDRHEILRTTFAVVGDQVCQRVHTFAPVALEEIDLRREPNPRSAATLRIAEDAAQPFDLRQGPLFRAMLLRLADTSHVFAYNLHHIITDATSQMILVRELNFLYGARASRTLRQLPPLHLQYKDFAAWQNEALDGPEVASHRDYWLAKFGGDLPELELATDFPRPPVKTFSGRCLVRTWKPELLDALERFARRENATLFLVLTALVRAQLFRYTEQNDIIIGCPVAGRDEPELENQIGIYTNTLALRQMVRAGDTFRAVLERERENFFEAYDHQLYPFDQLVSTLKLRRDVSRAPLFEVSVHLENIDVAELQLGALRVTDFPVEVSSAKLDLSYDFAANSRGLHCHLIYNTDLFREERVLAMQGHLRQLAEAILGDPTQRIESLTMLTRSERAGIVRGFNGEVRSRSEASIPELFEAEARRQPGAQAVVCGEHWLAFAELNARANQLAHYLLAEGVGLETRVGACLPRSVDWIVAVLAILKAGGVYVPLNPAEPLGRVAEILGDAQPPVIITVSDLEDRLPSYFGRVINLDLQWEDEIALASSENPGASPGPRNGAYLIYTSGSTGKQKGVLVEHRGFTHMIRDQIERFGVHADDRGLQFSNISFDASIYELFLALLAGACVVPVPRDVAAEAEAFSRFLERHGITMATLPPSFLRTIGSQTVAPLRLLITAGEAAAPEICLKAARTGRCVNAYGPTEVSVCAACHLVKADSDYRFGVPIGRPVGGSDLYVLDASLNPMPIGVPGELCIGGAGLARGYLNRPDLTAAAFVPDPFGPNPGSRLYRTGDLARWRSDGEIEFLGRKDSQVKVRGHRIELGEVEAALNRLPGVRETVATVRAAPDGSQRLMAYVTASNGPIAESALRAQLRDKLPDSFIPDIIVELATFPLTAAGKIDRKSLPAPESAVSGVAVQMEPRSNVERVLVDIFAGVVGRKQVGLRESFFDLGGNSLMATQAVSRIRKLLRVELSVPVLFESPSIEELAARLLDDEQTPGQMEKIATALLKFENLSKEERANLLARARE